jgi:hypothetical protein
MHKRATAYCRQVAEKLKDAFGFSYYNNIIYRTETEDA